MKISKEKSTKKLNKIDWLIMGIMVLLYGILSFIRLGDTKVPSTFYSFSTDNDAIVTLKENSFVSKLRFYPGNGLGDLKVSSSIDGKDYQDVITIDIGSVFCWNDIDIGKYAKYIKLSSTSDEVKIGEIALYGTENKLIPLLNDSLLTDESELVPDELSFMNSTYFDEIYYARSAYEYANGMDAYEWSHPPLGKLLITIPVAIFGFSPFTYRLMGNIFGILLIPLMYILAKKLFKDRKWAILGGLIMMFDCFHFAHTRIALVDGFQIFFILLSVLFMKEYLDLNKKDLFKKKAKYLLLSGTFIGCAIATKWNAFYPALGLAIVFFVHLFKENEFNAIKLLKSKVNKKNILKCLCILGVIPLALYYLTYLIINSNVSKTIIIVYYAIITLIILVILSILLFKDKKLFKLFCICVISFIVIPVIIYILSYILFPTLSYYDGTLKGIIDINKMMYDYHSNLVATHPFSSSWYEWPMMIKPVWFYTGNTLDGLRMTITDIGNPVIWWFGIISFIYLLISSFKNKEKNNIFLLIFILSSYVPYVFIGRLMFMYHYFITLPFIMLGIVSFVKYITEKTGNNKVYYSYIVLMIIMFIIFYPIISATPISDSYINSLKWLKGWFF